MFFKSMFPLEIIIEIAKTLYMKEFFTELEIMIYTFPILRELFKSKVPTIVLVDENQYYKVINFILTRERPFGSRDLFIIKQKDSNFTSSVSSRLTNSDIYVVLGSKFHQESIIQEFKLLKPCVTLIEHKMLGELGCTDKSYKCYRLKCSFSSRRKLRKPVLVRHPLYYSFNVALLLNAFLKPINPRMIRFESYSEKNDLHFEWLGLYGVYSSMVNMRYNRKVNRYYKDPARTKDRIVDTPKCSFEFVKDINKLSSLYQNSSVVEDDIMFWEWNSQTFNDPVTRDLKRQHTTSNTEEKTAFFHGLKNVTIDKIVSKGTREGINSSDSFIWIDCTKSAVKSDRATYLFIQDFHFCMPSKVLRKQVTKAWNLLQLFKFDSSMTDEEVKNKAGITKTLEESFVYYVDLFYKSFKMDRLEYADITAFNPNFRKSSLDDEEKLCTKCKGSIFKSCLDLKGLELRTNAALNAIQSARKWISKEFPEHGNLCEVVSENAMITIVSKILESIEADNLSETKPLRLRVFDNSTEKLINDRVRSECVDEWFHRKLER